MGKNVNTNIYIKRSYKSRFVFEGSEFLKNPANSEGILCKFVSTKATSLVNLIIFFCGQARFSFIKFVMEIEFFLVVAFLYFSDIFLCEYFIKKWKIMLI